jgi:hypothetical protein
MKLLHKLLCKLKLHKLEIALGYMASSSGQIPYMRCRHCGFPRGITMKDISKRRR